jgi:phosphoribosyl-ATP pyrophosphohydrolase/phosphoribosyl-AMP cyclohydrolase
MDFDLDGLDWEKMGGMIPAIVQDSASRRVLMLGYMSREALQRTLQSRRVTFWSRSRQELWTKGETSGNFLHLEDIQPDCDNDALLVLARPDGPTCHRGTRCCFSEDAAYPGLGFLSDLEQLIAQRRRELPAGSYTTRLFEEGIAKIAQKVGEEAVEVVVSAMQERQRTVEESADLLYHLLVFLTEREASLDEVLRQLHSRHHPSPPS